MKKTILLLSIGAVLAASCSRSGTSVTPTIPTTSTVFSRRFPAIGGHTLYHYINHVRTSDYAVISAAGVITVTGVSVPTQSGVFKIDIQDTVGSNGIYSFYLLRSPVDTFVCSGNFIDQIGGAYHMTLGNGNLPDNMIMAGDFSE